ncbi:MAG: hypothetical protein IK020_10935 [Clostridiales bacterium]|nr:hypothetical protein [Clostridiales bacterium]
MRLLGKKALSWCILVPFLLSPCGCKNKKETVHYDSGAYSSQSFVLPEKEGCVTYLQSVLPDGENYCVSAVYTQFDQQDEVIGRTTDIYTLNDKGEIVYTLELLGSQAPCSVLENEYVFLGYKNEDLENNPDNLMNLNRTAVFLDKKTGEPTKTIETDFDPWYVTPISDGFVIVGASTINRYSKEGVLLKSLKPGFSCYTERDGFFEENGKFYVVEDLGMMNIMYHEVDFDTGVCPPLAGNKDIGIDGRLYISGQYFFNTDGEYKVDLQNMKVKCLADWNCIDIRPPMKNLYSPAGYHRMDDERFAISYEYSDDTVEVMLFRFDPSVDRSQVETIKIGGYGVYNDQILQWVVYTFNVSNKDYRVVLEEYGKRFFEGLTSEERRKSTLNLMQYFHDGNAPDIFYGTRFDYEYMGRNGMVIDITEYLKKDEGALLVLTDTVSKLVCDGSGACYELFSGYQMYGNYALRSVTDAVSDTSVFSLFQYAQKHEFNYSMDAASDIVDEGIRYNFADLWGAYDGTRKVTHEELVELVSDVLSLPVSQMNVAGYDDVLDGRTMMMPSGVYSYYFFSDILSRSKDFRFIGYPSIHDSVYLAVPQCSLAISTTAKNKDKCWEVLSMLLGENVQKQTVSSGAIPVTQDALDTLCDIVMHPDDVDDEVLETFVRKDEPANQETVDLFLSTISKANAIQTVDWGVYGIISEEINSYYTQDRSPEQIAETLEKRLTLYMQENYQ